MINDKSTIVLTDYSHCQYIDGFHFVYVEKTNETIVLDSDLNFILDKLKSGSSTIAELISLAQLIFTSEANSDIAAFIETNVDNLVAQNIIKFHN